MSRTKKAERFLLARIALYLAGAASAAVGVYGWTASNDATSVVLAVFTGLSALIVPLSMEVVGKSIWSAFVIPGALLFGALNAYSFDHAVEVRIEQPRQNAYLATLAPLKAKAAAADVRTTALQAKLDAFPALIVRDCLCRLTRTTDLANWQATRAPLVSDLAAATVAADKATSDYNVKVGAYAPMAPKAVVWAASIGIDMTLALALAGISLVRASMQKRIDRKAEKLKHQASKIDALEEMLAEQTKALKKATKAPAKPKAAKEVRPLRGFTPYVAVSNP